MYVYINWKQAFPLIIKIIYVTGTQWVNFSAYTGGTV